MKGINQWRTEAGSRLLAGALEKRSRFLQVHFPGSASEPSKIVARLFADHHTKVASSEAAKKGMYLLHGQPSVFCC